MHTVGFVQNYISSHDYLDQHNCSSRYHSCIHQNMLKSGVTESGLHVRDLDGFFSNVNVLIEIHHDQLILFD